MSKQEKNEAVASQELNDQMLVRREKMEALRQQGIDPFGHGFNLSLIHI